MVQQVINTGSGELSGDGESIRNAFIKINENFTELYQKEYIQKSTLKTIVNESVDFEDFKNKIANL
jgi:hypothetical protein